MARNKKNIFMPVLLSVLLILPLALMFLHGRTGGRQSILTHLMSNLTAPGQHSVSCLLESLSTVWSQYIFLVRVEEQNQELRAQLKQITDTMAGCSDAFAENVRISRLLAFKQEKQEYQTVTARVIARDSSPYYRVIRVVLDRGLEDGVRVGMPVVTHQGLVGKVERVTGSYCDIMLITDSRSKLSAMVAGKELTGMLSGNGDLMSYSATFQFPFQRVELEPGDLLVTTGHEQVFPKGLAVGRLVSGTVNHSGRHLEVQVRPSVDIGHLEEVLIVISGYGPATDPWQGGKP